MSALDQFRGARARLQRYLDARFFAGWVVDLTTDQVIVALDHAEDLIPDDSCSIEIQGLRNTVVFSVCFESPLPNNGFIFRILSMQLVRGSDQGARYRVKQYEALVQADGVMLEGYIDNISEEGVGVRVRGMLRRGTSVKVQALLPRGEIEVLGTVIHCAPMDASGLDYRVGLRLDMSDRVVRARWTSLIKDVSGLAA